MKGPWRWSLVGAMAAAWGGTAAETFPTLTRLRDELPQPLVGHLLLEEYNCHRCHAGPTNGEARGAPRLEGLLQGRRHFDEIQRVILQPHGTMPQLLAHLESEDQAATATALTHYLASLEAPTGAKPIEDEGGEPHGGDAERGQTLFHEVGCVACHEPQASDLAERSKKFTAAGLVTFLQDPLAERPSGRMPHLQLSYWEARDLTAYLLGEGPRENAAETHPTPLDEVLVAKGKEAFARFGCAQCHQTEDERRPGEAPSWNESDLAAGCLSEAPGRWPRYALQDWEREAMREALGMGPDMALAEPHRGLKSMLQFNCFACHEREGLGGVPESRDAYFLSNNFNLGDQSRLPPTLTGVGAKLNPKWLHKVLEQGAAVRPYMKTRMPVFPRETMSALADWLSEADESIEVREVADLEEREARETGHRLTGVKGFGCVSCHTYKGQSATTLNALDLTTMTERLQKGWFQQYLRQPQAYQPLTIMPSYWPNGVSTRPDILEGDPDRQIEALWRYLERGREARVPEGIRREPIVLEVGEEAVMLRRQYPGVGKRGIGVGYPSGIHLVFDAGQMRLASLWTGEFVETSGVWRGQGSGNVRPLSREVYQFPEGPALAWLRRTGETWPQDLAKKAEGFQFQGYDLDALRRPTFRYRFDKIEIEDGWIDGVDEGGSAWLKRTLTLSPASSALYLRLAVGDAIVYRDGRYLVDERLELEPSRRGQIRRTEEGQPLLLLPMNEEETTIFYRLVPKS